MTVALAAMMYSGVAQAEKNLRQATPTELSTGQEKPNVVIIFTDDQGYADLGCFGSKENQTPVLDKLAKDGTKYTCARQCDSRGRLEIDFSIERWLVS